MIFLVGNETRTPPNLCNIGCTTSTSSEKEQNNHNQFCTNTRTSTGTLTNNGNSTNSTSTCTQNLSDANVEDFFLFDDAQNIETVQL